MLGLKWEGWSEFKEDLGVIIVVKTTFNIIMISSISIKTKMMTTITYDKLILIPIITIRNKI